MTRATALMAGLAVAAVTVAAWSAGAGERDAVASEAGGPVASASVRRAVVSSRRTKLGRILVVGSGRLRGRTLYIFARDRRRRSTCFRGCASAWPPLLTRGKPIARGGARASKLGVIRRGKRRQVTYAGHPLYRYAGDSRSGQTNGQALDSFGGRWWVLRPSGRRVTRRAAEPAPEPQPCPYY